MPLQFEPPPDGGSLRQGEVLANVIERRPLLIKADGEVEFVDINHPYAVVMSQDCDLERDFDLRFPSEGEPPAVGAVEAHLNSLSHILLCDAFPGADFKALVKQTQGYGSKEWKWLSQNNNERFHFLNGMPGATAPGEGELIAADHDPDTGRLGIDFRGHFAIPSSLAYDALGRGEAERLGVVPDVYLHDLVQRFYSYQSRVALPE